MVSVFLSHSSHDKPFVRDLAAALEADGEIKVWLDEREIGYGENIALKLGSGLDSDAVLLVLSPDSVESNWVKEEWSDAYWEQIETRRSKLAGVLYRDCTIPRLLRNKKYFDLRTNHPDGFRQIRTWLLGLRPAPPPIVHLPQRSPLFIGREPEIILLQSQLQQEGSVAYIPGLAGRGKTALALEYAHRYKRNFEAVHWIPCQGRTLIQLTGELARQLGLKLEGDLDAIVQELKDHCARRRCLLILDNVDDETPAPLLPGGRTSVLITTRFRNMHFLRHYKPIDLPLFSEEQCLELFRNQIGTEEVERHTQEARSLFQRLGYLPIGITITASLIREDVRYTIAGLAKNLPPDVTALLRAAVAALSAPAQTLLAAMAVCAPEGFRLGLAAEVASLDEPASLDALQEIYSRSLAEELDRTARRYRLHAMVREAAAATSLHHQRHAEAVAQEFKVWEANRRQCQEDMADWQSAFTWSLAQQGSDAWSTAEQLASSGYALRQRVGRLPEAYEIYERIGQQALRRDDAAVLATALGNQAVVLKAWGRLDEALSLLEKQEAICVKLGNPEGLQRTYGRQATILQDLGRLDEAIALLKRQEAICLDLGYQQSLQGCYGNQALIFQDRGDLVEAMALHKKEEAICVELGSRDGLQICYGNQALILRLWGKLEEAMALLARQEAICLELGNTCSLGYCYWNRALVARDDGDKAAQASNLQQALILFTELKMPREIKEVQEEIGKTDAARSAPSLASSTPPASPPP